MTIAVNPKIDSMHGYVPGEQLNDASVVKLNTNEAPYPAAPAVAQAIKTETDLALFNKYPDPTCFELRSAIAARFDITSEEVVVGNGSDEILRLVVHAFTRPGAGDKIATSNPTYTLYSVLAEMFGVEVESYASEMPHYSLSEMLIEAPAKIIFLPNPNPPIGTFYTTADLECLAAADPDRLVVIDEAYVDFAPNDAVSVYKNYDNVVITRTFSKSYALAGLRAGFIICRPELAAVLNKIKDSYNVNRLTQVAALAAWNAREYYKDMVKQILVDRAFLAGALKERGFVVPDSHGNFVFARKAGVKKLYDELKHKKILVRHFDLPALKDGIRITVGTRSQLDQLLAAIDGITAKL